MNRIGGTATIHSAPGQGTAVELSWPDRPRSEARPSPVIDADRLFKRRRTRYGYALVGWALLGRPIDDAGMLAVLAPYAPQRARAVRYVELSGFRKPRFGPRYSPRDYRAM